MLSLLDNVENLCLPSRSRVSSVTLTFCTYAKFPITVKTAKPLMKEVKLQDATSLTACLYEYSKIENDGSNTEGFDFLRCVKRKIDALQSPKGHNTLRSLVGQRMQ